MGTATDPFDVIKGGGGGGVKTTVRDDSGLMSGCRIKPVEEQV